MEYIETNGVRLHTRVEGDPNNQLLILLHGFPEFNKAWEKLVDPLVEEGYYVLVPDQRGYNLSSKPRGRKNYHLDQLVDDVMGLIDWAGKKKAIIAGHDWGGFIAWGCAISYPERVEQLIIVNAPHPTVFADFLTNDPQQRKKSSYIRMFRIPFLPELMLKRRNYGNLVRSLKGSSKKGTFSDEDIEEYRTSWRNSSLSGMLNYYRANKLGPGSPVEVDTLIVWGREDRFLSHKMAEESLKQCPKTSQLSVIEGSHWVLHERPEQVTSLILGFLGS